MGIARYIKVLKGEEETLEGASVLFELSPAIALSNPLRPKATMATRVVFAAFSSGDYGDCVYAADYDSEVLYWTLVEGKDIKEALKLAGYTIQ